MTDEQFKAIVERLDAIKEALDELSPNKKRSISFSIPSGFVDARVIKEGRIKRTERPRIVGDKEEED